jgi:hypothetical protein
MRDEDLETGMELIGAELLGINRRFVEAANAPRFSRARRS